MLSIISIDKGKVLKISYKLKKLIYKRTVLHKNGCILIRTYVVFRHLSANTASSSNFTGATFNQFGASSWQGTPQLAYYPYRVSSRDDTKSKSNSADEGYVYGT